MKLTGVQSEPLEVQVISPNELWDEVEFQRSYRAMLAFADAVWNLNENCRSNEKKIEKYNWSKEGF